MSERQVGPYTIKLSNLDRVLFPGEGITKGDLVDYYARIAPVMLPYVCDRPLMTQHFPRGITEPGFHQQNAPAHYPDWVGRVTVEKEGGTVTHPVITNEASLVYLANQNVITPHIWQSRADRLDYPDRLVFDLDPPAGDFAPVPHAARETRALLDALGVPTYVMTTGSSGLHVVVPLDRSADFEAARAFATDVADLLVRRHPKELTVAFRKDSRGGRVFVDTFRNSYGATAVPPYAVRPKPGAPVATPLDWDEIDRPGMTSRTYTIENLFRRLGQKDDPWAGFEEHAIALDEPRHRLDELLAEEPD